MEKKKTMLTRRLLENVYSILKQHCRLVLRVNANRLCAEFSKVSAIQAGQRTPQQLPPHPAILPTTGGFQSCFYFASLHFSVYEFRL